MGGTPPRSDEPRRSQTPPNRLRSREHVTVPYPCPPRTLRWRFHHAHHCYISTHLADCAHSDVSRGLAGIGKRPRELEQPLERRVVRLKWVSHEGSPRSSSVDADLDGDAQYAGLALESFELISAPLKQLRQAPTPDLSLAAARLLACLVNSVGGAQQHEGGLVFTTTVPLRRHCSARRAPPGPPTREALVPIPVPQEDHNGTAQPGGSDAPGA